MKENYVMIAVCMFSITFFLAIIVLANNLMVGMTRSAAISNGWTADQYIQWVDILNE